MAPNNAAAKLPPVMPFPTTAIRPKINFEDWSACLQAWELVTRMFLGLPSELFEIVVKDANSSMTIFLTSCIWELADPKHDKHLDAALRNKSLLRNMFLLSHRTLVTVVKPADVFLDWRYLGCLSRVFRHSPSLGRMLGSTWEKYADNIETSMSSVRLAIVEGLETGKGKQNSQDELARGLLPFLQACPSAGAAFLNKNKKQELSMLGAVIAEYTKVEPPLQRMLLVLIYLCLYAFTKAACHDDASLLAHLNEILSETEAKRTPDFLQALVTETPLLLNLEHYCTAQPDYANAATLLKTLSTYRRETSKQQRPWKRKDRRQQIGAFGHAALDDVHVHRMSAITQLQDLFPDLGAGFLAKLLDHYSDDIETVTAHLLEDDLPPELSTADRTQALPDTHQHPTDIAPDLAPRSTPYPQPPAVPRLSTNIPPSSTHPPSSEPAYLTARRNIHDTSAPLDSLTLGTSRLHIGHRETSTSIDIDSNTRATNKAAILSALAAFDADDDERDDTYDIEDVGGTVDTSAPEPGGDAAAKRTPRHTGEDIIKNEEILYHAFLSHPQIFERNSATRLSQPRRALKEETGMTDEAVEGWAIMLKRDTNGREMRRLEGRYGPAGFGGRSGQSEIKRTAWRNGNDGGDTTEDSEGGAGSGTDQRGGVQGRGGGRGRGGFAGRGRGGGGGGHSGSGGRGAGNVAGESGDKATQIARQRKDARGSHNRREGRAKKLARAGFPG